MFGSRALQHSVAPASITELGVLFYDYMETNEDLLKTIANLLEIQVEQASTTLASDLVDIQNEIKYGKASGK